MASTLSAASTRRDSTSIFSALITKKGGSRLTDTSTLPSSSCSRSWRPARTKTGVAAAKSNMDRITELAKLEQEELVRGNRTPADVAEAVVAYENAACAYLEVRHGRGPSEIEILRKRVEALEKQLGSPRKPSEPPVTRRN